MSQHVRDCLLLTADKEAAPVKLRSRDHITSTLQLKSESDIAANIGLHYTVVNFLRLTRYTVPVHISNSLFHTCTLHCLTLSYQIMHVNPF